MSFAVKAFTVVAVVLGSASAGAAADFASAVETVLLKQEEIAKLDSGRKGQMIACVNEVLQEVPAEKQNYVAEAANFDEMESRFGEVVLADRAKLKQEITQKCGGIAVSQ